MGEGSYFLIFFPPVTVHYCWTISWTITLPSRDPQLGVQLGDGAIAPFHRGARLGAGPNLPEGSSARLRGQNITHTHTHTHTQTHTDTDTHIPSPPPPPPGPGQASHRLSHIHTQTHTHTHTHTHSSLHPQSRVRRSPRALGFHPATCSQRAHRGSPRGPPCP